MIWMFLARFVGIRGLRKLRSMSYMSNTMPSAVPNKKSNIGNRDRAFRATVGAVALALLMVIKEGFVVRYLLGLAALVGLVTAYTKFSPVYALIGENTRKKGK